MTHRSSSSSDRTFGKGRTARVLSAIGTAAVFGGVAVLAACSDAPLAPSASRTLAPADANRDVVSTATSTVSYTVQALLRSTPLLDTLRASAVIGPDGGEVEIKAAGVKLSVEEDAVRVPTKFTIKALPGSVVAYDFSPSGAYPKGSLRIRQSLVGTSAEPLVHGSGVSVVKDKNKLSGVTFEGAYFASANDIDMKTGRAVVKELKPTTVDVKGKSVEFKVDHFSGYMVSTGRY